MPQKNPNWFHQYRAWRQSPHGQEVYKEASAQAAKMCRIGFKRYSMQMIVYIVRYHRHLKTGKDEAGWKVNNNFTSYLARELQNNGVVPRSFFTLRN